MEVVKKGAARLVEESNSGRLRGKGGKREVGAMGGRAVEGGKVKEWVETGRGPDGKSGKSEWESLRVGKGPTI
jgi:hypothetical protein